MAGGYTLPTYVTSPPGDASRLFVTQQAGVISLVRGGTPVATPFLDISGLVLTGGERGLLSMAFAPDYATSGKFYVYFTGAGGDIHIEEYRRSSNPDRADPATRRLVLDDRALLRGQPQRRAAAVRAGRLPLRGDRRRRRGQRQPRQRAEPGHAARQAAAHRPGPLPAARAASADRDVTAAAPPHPRSPPGSGCCASAARWPTAAPARQARWRSARRCGSASARTG